MKKRVQMSNCEKRILDANIKLTNEKNETIKDIVTLISYINGNEVQEDIINEIIGYYSKFQVKRKDYKRYD